MKKNIFGAVLIAAMAVATSLIFKQSKNETKLSDLALANVVALARGEDGNGTIYCCGNYGVCMKVIDSQGKTHDVAGVRSTSPCP